MMEVLIAADHAGYELKEALKVRLPEVAFRDLGVSNSTEAADYPELVQEFAAQFQPDAVGVLICGSGIGMAIAANRHSNLRALVVEHQTAAHLGRAHNHANVLCLGARITTLPAAIDLVRTFLETPYSTEERHQRRVDRLGAISAIAQFDPMVDAILRDEANRQSQGLELIASENYASRAVLEAQGSIFTNKYAEGYPGKRYYGGCEHADQVEQLAIDRACALFGTTGANVQPHSGSQANMAVFFALMKPGDGILGLGLNEGGHLTHGSAVNFSGQLYRAHTYGLHAQSHLIDYDQVRDMALRHRPRVIVAGTSAYSRKLDFALFGEIARESGAELVADIAHIAGLVAAELHPSPVGHATLITSTTHKTLRGPRGGIILGDVSRIKEANRQIFPGLQGGPLVHVMAAKAIAFGEALRPSFRTYQAQILENARTLAQSLQEHGIELVSGGTDNHLVLLDFTRGRYAGLTGREVDAWCGTARMTVNKNSVPADPRGPFVTSGVRIGVPAVTTRGLRAPEMSMIGKFISRVLESQGDLDLLKRIGQEVQELCRLFPLPQ